MRCWSYSREGAPLCAPRTKGLFDFYAQGQSHHCTGDEQQRQSNGPDQSRQPLRRQHAQQEQRLSYPDAAPPGCVGEVNLANGDKIAEQRTHYRHSEAQQHEGGAPDRENACQEGAESSRRGEPEISFAIQVAAQLCLPVGAPGKGSVGHIGDDANQIYAAGETRRWNHSAQQVRQQEIGHHAAHQGQRCRNAEVLAEAAI